MSDETDRPLTPEEKAREAEVNRAMKDWLLIPTLLAILIADGVAFHCWFNARKITEETSTALLVAASIIVASIVFSVVMSFVSSKKGDKLRANIRRFWWPIMFAVLGVMGVAMTSFMILAANIIDAKKARESAAQTNETVQVESAAPAPANP